MREASARGSDVMCTQSTTHIASTADCACLLEQKKGGQASRPRRLSVPGDYMSPKEVRHHHQSIKILIYNTELDQSDKIKYLLKDYIQRLTYIHRPLKAIVQKRSNVYDTHELQTIRHETETYLWQNKSTDIIQIEMTGNKWDFGFIMQSNQMIIIDWNTYWWYRSRVL